MPDRSVPPRMVSNRIFLLTFWLLHVSQVHGEFTYNVITPCALLFAFSLEIHVWSYQLLILHSGNKTLLDVILGTPVQSSHTICKQKNSGIWLGVQAWYFQRSIVITFYISSTKSIQAKKSLTLRNMSSNKRKSLYQIDRGVCQDRISWVTLRAKFEARSSFVEDISTLPKE